MRIHLDCLTGRNSLDLIAESALFHPGRTVSKHKPLWPGKPAIAKGSLLALLIAAPFGVQLGEYHPGRAHHAEVGFPGRRVFRLAGAKDSPAVRLGQFPDRCLKISLGDIGNHLFWLGERQL